MKGSLDLSKETETALRRFLDVLTRWNGAINLVARGDSGGWWERHVLDSLQLARFVGASGKWVDLGTGGGFPGMVLAIWARGQSSGTEFVLVESDARKCEFLRAVSRETDVQPTIINDRIERVEPQCADIVSSRGLAPLSTLCGMALRHLKPSGRAIFLKGVSIDIELDEARKHWSFVSTTNQSVTSEQGSILILEALRAR